MKLPKYLLLTAALLLWHLSLLASGGNLFDLFQKIKDDFPHQGLTDFSAHRYFVTYGDSCVLKHADFEIQVPEIKAEISHEVEKKSSLYKGGGHLLSFNQFNDSIIFVVIAIHGHYSTPSSILFIINRKGNIVSEIIVSSEFFDGGNGSLTQSRILNSNSLEIIHKDLGERGVDVPCMAEIEEYKILENGILELRRTYGKKIECKK